MIEMISSLFGLSMTFVVLTIGAYIFRPANLSQRVRSVVARSRGLSGKSGANGERESMVQHMHKLVRKLDLAGSTDTKSIAELLARAGYRSQESVMTYLFVRSFLPIIVLIVSCIAFLMFNILNYEFTTNTIIVVGLVVASIYGPSSYINNITQKRAESITDGLPDALDLMVICSEAGLSLDLSIRRVSIELTPTAPELADELQHTSAELNFLPDRKQALVNLTNRCISPGIKNLATTLIQTEKYGTPLTSSLKMLTAEMREDRRMRSEEKAAKLPAVMTVPMVLFILPPLFIVLLGPAVLRTMDTMFK